MTDPHLHNLEPHANTLEALRQPRVLWMCLMYWIYTGIESVAGYLLFSFLTTERHYSIEVAGITTGCYWGSLTLGRIFFGQVSNHFPKESLLKGVAMIAIGSSLLIAFKTPVPTELIGASLLASYWPLYSRPGSHSLHNTLVDAFLTRPSDYKLGLLQSESRPFLCLSVN